MKINSAETQLRLGDKNEVQAMLESFPILFNCRRLTFRNVNFYLKDLFMGIKGEAERKGIDGDLSKLSSIKLKMIDVTKAIHPRPGSDGLTVCSEHCSKYCSAIIEGCPSLDLMYA